MKVTFKKIREDAYGVRYQFDNGKDFLVVEVSKTITEHEQYLKDVLFGKFMDTVEIEVLDS